MASGSHMTAEIWSLTLQIIHLLTGETYPDVKPGDHVTITVSPPPSLTPDRYALQKILEVTRKITELLIGEMESPLELCLEMKAENEAEPVPEEAGYLGAMGGDLWLDGKMEPSEVTPVTSPLVEYGEESSEELCKEEESSHLIDAEPEDALISEDEEIVFVKIKEEEIPLEICPDEKYGQTQTDEHAAILSHGETEDEIAEESTGTVATQSPHPVLTPVDVSSHPDSAFHLVLPPLHTAQAKISHCDQLESVHTEETSYSCSFCGNCFYQKAHLIRHERSHTGEKPYPCSECGKSFSRSSALIRHKRVHTGEKPYACSQCGKCFSQKSDLSSHERVHTGEKPYSCSDCGKCFCYKSAYIRHKRVHTGDKPYSCFECGRCFCQKSDLISHKRIHTGEKPFSCSICGKCFYEKSALRKHEKRHTK